jgi:hypothetical protein
MVTNFPWAVGKPPPLVQQIVDFTESRAHRVYPQGLAFAVLIQERQADLNSLPEEKIMSIEKKSLISNRIATKKAIATKPEATKVVSTKVAHARVAPARVAPARVAPARVAPARVAPARVAPARVAPARVRF